MTAPTSDSRVDKIARGQHGLIELRQAEEAGVTYGQVLVREHRGSLRRVHAGVYAMMGTAPTWEQSLHAAGLAAGSACLASHRAAAVLWDLIRPPAPVEVVVPYAQGPCPRDVIVHRSTDIRPTDVASRRGIPVTNPLRTVADLGAVAPGLVPYAIERGLYHRLFTVAGLWHAVDTLGRPGRRGIGVLRRNLEQRALDDRRTCSPLEPIFATIAREAGVRLQYQHPVKVDGQQYYLDFALPESMVAIEIDGLEVHSTREALDRDLERQNRLILAGWHLLRYTYTHLVKQRRVVRRDLLQLIAQRTPRL